MKKTIKLTLMFVGLLVGSALYAQTNMHLETISGTSTYLIDDVKVITFSSTDLMVENTSGVTTPFVLNDMVKITFDDVSDAVNEIENMSDINVYPNPSNGMVTLNIENGNASEYNINVYNSLGSLIETIKVPSNGSEVMTTIDFTQFTDGVYIMNISGNDESNTTRKIIIQK